MPDVPDNPTDIVAAARARAGVVAGRVAALGADLAASRGGPAADDAVRADGVARLAALAAALTALEQLFAVETVDEPKAAPETPAADEAGPGPGGTETHDHGRRP